MIIERLRPADDAATTAASLLRTRPLAGKRVLIIVENLPVPFDRRVWQEATTLQQAGATVSVICPTSKNYTRRSETIDGIHVYRHPLPLDANGPLGYLLEYATALFWQVWLALKVLRRHGFDVIHACNPPDLIFLVALLFKPFGKRFVFDHHDINPELYEAKFGRRGPFYHLMLWLERLTFMAADVSIATNDSYRQIAIERGKMAPEKVHVVRSGPNLAKLRRVPPNPALKNNRRFLVGYVGVMGQQEGIELLLQSVDHIVHTMGRTDIQFCLVGGGPCLRQLKSDCAALRLADYVTFTGRAPDQQLFEVLSTADVCVNPDRVNAMNDKSTMNKILEYMAFAKPIVQFDVTEGRHSAGDAALYARPNDPADMAQKLVTLLDDPTRRTAMGTIGHHRIQSRFSWNHQIPTLIAAYRQVLNIEEPTENIDSTNGSI